MSIPVFYTLELSDTKARRLRDPKVVTFYYKGMYYGFTTQLEKAIRFDTHEIAYAFIQKHGLYNFEVIQAKGYPKP
ncbi:MAG: hypothetical protein ACXWQE_00165 [Bdellovibrionales bacterium]